MKQRNNHLTRKLIAILMVIAMVPALLPCIAFADETDGEVIDAEPAKAAAKVEDVQKHEESADAEAVQKTEAPANVEAAQKPEAPADVEGVQEAEVPADVEDVQEAEVPAGAEDGQEAEVPAGAEDGQEPEITPANAEDVQEPEIPQEPETPAADAPENEIEAAGLEETDDSDPAVRITPEIKADPAKPVRTPAASTPSRVKSSVKSSDVLPATAPAALPAAVITALPAAASGAGTVTEITARPAILNNHALLSGLDDVNYLPVSLQNLIRERRDGSDSWTLMDLIAMLMTSAIGVMMIIAWLIIPEDRDRDEKAGPADGSLFLRSLGLIPVAASIMIFFLTQDLTQPVHLADQYTGLLMFFLAVEIFIAAIVRKDYLAGLSHKTIPEEKNTFS